MSDASGERPEKLSLLLEYGQARIWRLNRDDHLVEPYPNTGYLPTTLVA